MRIPCFVLLLLLFTSILMAAEPKSSSTPPNIMFMISDDLACTLGCYGHPLAQTPNIDQLAKQGTLFKHAYCQFPHCNPSRSSIMSGLRPHLTKVADNGDSLYKNVPGIITLPHYFRQQGYQTARCGKIFHLGIPSGDESMDDPQAWDFGTPFKDERPYPKQRKSIVDIKPGKSAGFSWNESTATDSELVDGMHTDQALEWLSKRDPQKPFFLAVGFHRPHLPFVAPATYFDKYPIGSITLPDEPADDEMDIPLPARNGAVPGYTNNADPEQRKAAIRAYLASVSYVDTQVGRLTQYLKDQKIDQHTIVIFTSDHGWHLGEHKLWHKRSLFEESSHVPLIIYDPQSKSHHATSASLVELLDLYPTLCDLTGLTPPSHLQGKSMKPILNDPQAKIHDAAFTHAQRGKNLEYRGDSIRTDKYRYTEWNHGEAGRELYDHTTDPHEYTNLAEKPEHQQLIQTLSQQLRPNSIYQSAP